MASILAVDDEVGILDMIQSILSKDGHSVTGITKKIRSQSFKPKVYPNGQRDWLPV